MSLQLTDLRPDLQRIVEEGYQVEIRDGHLLVHCVPYATAGRQVARGSLVMPCDAFGPDVVRPPDHQTKWDGDAPCNAQGHPLDSLSPRRAPAVIADGVEVEYNFSARPQPTGHYADFYRKVVHYVEVISREARHLQPDVSPLTRLPPILSNESPFAYEDTSTTRAGIRALSQRFHGMTVGIVGLGGTGSYLLDFISKTYVSRIDVWDDDVFQKHTAFRAPGAATLEEVQANHKKADHHAGKYVAIHSMVVPHAEPITEANLDQLSDCDWVFLAIDPGPTRKLVADYLATNDISFIDAGLGLLERSGALRGKIRVSSFNAADDDSPPTLPGGNAGRDEYAQNIQVAEINALAAVLAIIRWKQMLGYYWDERNGQDLFFTLSTLGAVRA